MPDTHFANHLALPQSPRVRPHGHTLPLLSFRTCSRERQGVVTLGTLQPDGSFRAQEGWSNTTKATCRKTRRRRCSAPASGAQSSARHRQPQPGTRWRRIRPPADEQNGARLGFRARLGLAIHTGAFDLTARVTRSELII